MSSLRERLLFTTTQLGESYAAWKEEERNKEDDRKAFFELALEQLRGDSNIELRTKVVEVTLPVASIALAKERVARKHPRFTVEGVQQTGDTTYKAVLKENPDFVTWSFINEHDGKVYTRRVDDGALKIDEALMRESDEELYESVTVPTWNGARVMCPLDFMSASMRQSVADYIFPGPPKVVLSPPRDIKPEDME